MAKDSRKAFAKTPNFGTGWFELTGAKPVTLEGYEEFDLILHRPVYLTAGEVKQSAEGWQITEGITGSSLLAFAENTRAGAIEHLAKRMARRNKGDKEKTIAEWKGLIRDYATAGEGLSPRYTAESLPEWVIKAP